VGRESQAYWAAKARLQPSLPIPQFPVYVFDVDGTLVDSAADICGAIQQVLATRQRHDIPDTFLRRYIGRHLLDLFQDVFPSHTPAQFDEMIAEYRQVYPLREHAQTNAYPGIAELLARLPGKKATATTKGTLNTRRVLELKGLLPFFDHVQGTDGFPAKPAPDVLFHALDSLGAQPADCLFIGDSPADMEAGRRAGIKTCAVLWGYGDREEMARWEPDYWVSEPGQLGRA
jgi:phosphoglycolate phosphatase